MSDTPIPAAELPVLLIVEDDEGPAAPAEMGL